MAKNKYTGYELSRVWFDFCFENPDKVRTIHTALYFFAIEHCNRLGWKEKFGLPTEMSKEALGIKSWHTYIKAFNDLIEWGFFILVQRSKNQYSSNIIALSKNDEANDEALDEALTKHVSKHLRSTYQSNDSINKPITKEPKTKEHSSKSKIDFDIFVQKYNSLVRGNMPKIRIMTDARKKNLKSLLQKYSKEQILEVIDTASQSDWVTSKTFCDIAWILKEDNFVKVLEGKFNNNYNQTNHSQNGGTPKDFEITVKHHLPHAGNPYAVNKNSGQNIKGKPYFIRKGNGDFWYMDAQADFITKEQYEQIKTN